MELHTLGAVFLPELDFRRPKPLLLLAYLCLEGPQPRRELSELFWPTASDPRDSLSTTVSRLNGAHDGLVEVNGRTLTTAVECDAAEVLSLLDGGHYRAATDRYEGPFMHGLDLSLPPELEDWVFDTRDYLARRVRVALLALVETAVADGDIGEAGRLAEAAVKVSEQSPLEAHELRALHHTLSLSESPLAARVASEAEELGVDLTDAKRLTGLAAEGSVQRLPQATSMFVGRDQELEAIRTRIADPHCSLITVHGPGGIGKTRLALEAAREYARVRGTDNFTAFVQLEHTESADRIPEAIANAIGLALRDETDEFEQVCAELRGGAFLLVLDNFDHLVGGAKVLGEFIRRCPRLTLLVTSRELLHLAEEHVIPVRGLATASADGEAGAAVDLLIDRVRRSRGPFEPTAHELAAAQNIAELVGGSPLGIELVASWANALPLSEIEASLSRSSELLVSRDSNVPERQRDLDALFDRSWRLLPTDQRTAFTRLGVFQGSFTLTDAEQVAACDRSTLASLVDRSLVSRTPDDRFFLHPLLRLASQAKLAADTTEANRSRARHYRYFLEDLARRAGDAATGEVGDYDFDNVRAAWIRALEAGEFALTERALPALAEFADRRARFMDGRTMLLHALDALNDREPDGTSSLRALLNAHVGWLSHRLGDHQRALATAAPLLFPPYSHSPDVTFLAHRTVAASRFKMGAYREAAAACVAAIDLSGGTTEAYADPEILETFAMILCEEGRFDDSRGLLSRALTQYRSRRDSDGVAGTLDQLATVYLNLKRPLDAKPLLEEALRLARASDRDDLVSHCYYGLGITALELGDYQQARDMCSRTLYAARRAGDASRQAAALSVLFRCAAQEGADEAARQHLREGLSQSLAIGEIPRTLKFLIYTAEWWLETRGREAEASGILEFVLAQPQVAFWARRLAEDLLQELAAQPVAASTPAGGTGAHTPARLGPLDNDGASGARNAPGVLTFEEAVGKVLAYVEGA